MPSPEDIRKAQADFARSQIAREHQSADDRAEIKVKVIENGVLVKTGEGWFSFPDWDSAAPYIGRRIEALRKKRAGGA